MFCWFANCRGSHPGRFDNFHAQITSQTNKPAPLEVAQASVLSDPLGYPSWVAVHSSYRGGGRSQIPQESWPGIPVPSVTLCRSLYPLGPQAPHRKGPVRPSLSDGEDQVQPAHNLPCVPLMTTQLYFSH